MPKGRGAAPPTSRPPAHRGPTSRARRMASSKPGLHQLAQADLPIRQKQPPGDGSDVSPAFSQFCQPRRHLASTTIRHGKAGTRRLSVKLQFQFYAFADLAPKFGTLIARQRSSPTSSGTLVRQDIPLTPELFLPARAARHSRHSSSGDAIKEYPNLAALPTRSWKGMLFDNKICGVRCRRHTASSSGGRSSTRNCWISGDSASPGRPDEYKQVMVALNEAATKPVRVYRSGRLPVFV